jgi:hypothetical protein
MSRTPKSALRSFEAKEFAVENDSSFHQLYPGNQSVRLTNSIHDISVGVKIGKFKTYGFIDRGAHVLHLNRKLRGMVGRLDFIAGWRCL